MTDTTGNKQRPSITLSRPLVVVLESLRDDQSLSSRLATIAERYQLACSQSPDLTKRRDKPRHFRPRKDSADAEGVL